MVPGTPFAVNERIFAWLRRVRFSETMPILLPNIVSPLPSAPWQALHLAMKITLPAFLSPFGFGRAFGFGFAWASVSSPPSTFSSAASASSAACAASSAAASAASSASSAAFSAAFSAGLASGSGLAGYLKTR